MQSGSERSMRASLAGVHACKRASMAAGEFIQHMTGLCNGAYSLLIAATLGGENLNVFLQTIMNL